MQNFKMSFIQDDLVVTEAFQLSNEKAKDFGIILGTGVNNLFRQIDLRNAMGNRLFRANLPIQVKIEGEGLNLDSDLIEAGVEGVQKSITMALKVSGRAFKQAQFAKRLNAAFAYLLQPVVSKHIDVVIEERIALIPVAEVVPQVAAIAEKIEG